MRRVLVLAFTLAVMAMGGTGVISVTSNEAPAEMAALLWMKENLPEEGAVIASVSEGFLVSSIAQKQTMMDSNFLLRNEVEEKIEDIRTVFTTDYQTAAIRLLNQYNVKYILLTPTARSDYGIESLPYVSGRCFNIIFEQDDIVIYESLCELDE